MEASGRPDVLRRHGRTALHKKAVFTILGLDDEGLAKVSGGRLGLEGRQAWGVRCFVGLSTCPKRLRDLGGAAVGTLPARLGQREARWHARGGIEGVGGANRVKKGAWCLYEVLREADAAFLLHTAQTIWLARDARKQRLLIRFRAVGFKNGELVSRVGVLGQAKEYGTDAAGIVDATLDIVKAAVTKGQDRPAGLGNALGASVHNANAHGASDSSEADAATVLQKVEALTVDAAADEVLAGELMRGRCDIGHEQGMCPNLKLVVRDKTHASRRTTQKPEACDAFLPEVVDKLFKDKNSITQLIHNSHVWSAHFAAYVQDVEEKVGEGIRNVRGAKHRHESAAKPRGRFVLLMDAYIQVAMRMLHGRQDDVQKHAQ